jgi:hypothetical protein
MKLGVCYYPEHWPQERWLVDARLMRQAGLSLVRIADFAWVAMEPKEGAFTWDWLDQGIGRYWLPRVLRSSSARRPPRHLPGCAVLIRRSFPSMCMVAAVALARAGTIVQPTQPITSNLSGLSQLLLPAMGGILPLLAGRLIMS